MPTVKPIIKLPPRNVSTGNGNIRPSPSVSSHMPTNFTKYSPNSTRHDLNFSKELFFEDPNDKISDYDLRNVLQGFNILQIRREPGGGYLSFLNASVAERAYTLFNGYMFTAQIVLRFRLYSAGDPQPEGDLWEVSNLPLHIDHNALYDIFRPYGSLSICKSLIEDRDFTSAVHEGKALIQYFSKNNSDRASAEMNGKIIDGNRIQITLLLMNSKSSRQLSAHDTSSTDLYHRPTPMADKREAGFVDYLNLYIKNLDPTVDNNDLFNLFRKFGRIVSARIMTNPQNGQSKGYGFVSFGKPEEAAAALEEMNGYQFRTKPIIVAYHEPKKPRQEKSTSTATSSFHSPPPSSTPLNGNAPSFEYASTTTAAPNFDMKHPHDVIGLGIDHVDQLSMNIKLEDSSVGTTNSSIAILTPSSFNSPPTATRSTINAMSTYSTHSQQNYQPHNSRPSLASLASGASIQQSPPNMHFQQQQQNTMYDHMRRIEEEVINEKQYSRSHSPHTQQYTKTINGLTNVMNHSGSRPSLRRRGSVESINSTITESTAQVQRHRMTEAVKRCCMETPTLMMIVTNQQQQQQTNDIVDMLLTLNKKERSICLFNRDFLKEKIFAAVEALEICDDRDMDEVQEQQSAPIVVSLPSEAASSTIVLNNNHKRGLSGAEDILTARPIASTTLGQANNSMYNNAATAGSPIEAMNPSFLNTTTTNENVVIPPRKSKAIPIVAPTHLDTAKQEEIRALLDSLEGKPIHEKKQQLGDQLFPLVKATGVRHAPKITIRLLDTIELETLAKIMYDKESLKAEVDKASTSL